jgi:ribokinase
LGTDHLLTVLGAINWDTSIFEERFAKQGEEVPVNRVEEFSGGKGANVAVAAARILGKQRVAFVGALGNDDVSGKQLAELRGEGVITDGVVKLKGCQSGRAYIVVDGAGKKTIHTHFGANERMTAKQLRRPRVLRSIEDPQMIVVMDAPTEVGRRAVELARGRGKTVIYSPAVRTTEGLRSLEPILREADYLVVDQIELRNLYPDKAEGDEELMRLVTATHPHLTLVATLGERGCAVTGEGVMTRVEGVDVASLGKRVVNTTGCGDAFLGVFAGHLLLDFPILEAAKRANLAGALKATRYETRGSPTLAELEKDFETLEKVRQRRPVPRVSRGA